MSDHLRQLYKDARRYYKLPRWTRPALVSKRLRMVIRLIALEEQCREMNVGALPPKMMEQLRLLSGYRDAVNKRRYQHRKVGPPKAGRKAVPEGEGDE